MIKMITEVYLKDKRIIAVNDPDVYTLKADTDIFLLKKDGEYCYLIPRENISFVVSK